MLYFISWGNFCDPWVCYNTNLHKISRHFHISYNDIKILYDNCKDVINLKLFSRVKSNLASGAFAFHDRLWLES